MTVQQHAFAGFRARVLAFIFDYLLILFWLILMLGIGLTIRSVFPDTAKTLFGTPGSSQITGFVTVTLPVSLYFARCEASTWQATWGKRQLGLIVVDSRNERLTLPRSLSRTGLKFIPWELAHTCIWQISFAPQDPSPWITAGFVVVWALVGANIVSLVFSRTNQALYDRLAGTFVVKCSP